MSEDDFWAIIERTLPAAQVSYQQQIDTLTAEIEQYSTPDVASFCDWFNRMSHRAGCWDLLAASYLMGAGADSMQFERFVTWLIASGRAVYESAITDVDALADIDLSRLTKQRDWKVFEALRTAPLYVHCLRKDRSFGDGGWQFIGIAAGEPWSPDASVFVARFPRLWAKYGRRKNALKAPAPSWPAGRARVEPPNKRKAEVEPMSVDEFWSIIDRTVAAGKIGRHEQTEALSKRLHRLSRVKLIAFDRRYRMVLDAAYTWDLWGAGYVMGHGCSDDGFTEFRNWLIAKGRAIYERALADAESLASFERPPIPDGEVWPFFGEFDLVVSEVYGDKTGEDFPIDDIDGPREPLGEPWKEDPEVLSRRFPKLWAKFGPRSSR